MEEMILAILAEACEDESVKDHLDIDLFESGLMDSLAFAELVFGLADKLGVIISPSEIERDKMNTPRKILELVKERAGS